MKQAFHDLVWYSEEGDGPACLWVVGRLVRLQEDDNLGTASHFQELEREETDSAERLEPFHSLAGQVLYELRVDVADTRSFA